MNYLDRNTATRRPSRLALIASAICLLAARALCLSADQEAGRPVVLLFGGKGLYRMAAEAASKELLAANKPCVVLELPDKDDAGRRDVVARLLKLNPRVVAAGGADATIQSLQACPKTPVVFFMVPNALDAPFMRPDRRGPDTASSASPVQARPAPIKSRMDPSDKTSVSTEPDRIAGVASDISPTDQIEWIIRTQPDAKHVVILCGPRTQRTAAALESASRGTVLKVTTLPAARDRFPEAIEAIAGSRCDGVLMIPDADVYNSPNVERLLLWGIRNKKPIWSFSENVVKAGAFAGLFCDAHAVGRQTAGLVADILEGADAGKTGVHYPRSQDDGVRRAVNLHTAKLIGRPLHEEVLGKNVIRFGGE